MVTHVYGVLVRARAEINAMNTMHACEKIYGNECMWINAMNIMYACKCMGIVYERVYVYHVDI